MNNDDFYATADFSENETRGLMICGYEWGGDPDEVKETNIEEERLSFFLMRLCIIGLFQTRYASGLNFGGSE